MPKTKNKTLSTMEIAQLTPKALLSYLLQSDLDTDLLGTCLLENRCGGDSLGYALIMRLYYDEKETAIIKPLLALLLSILETHPEMVIEEIEQRHSMVDAIYRSFIFKNTSENMPAFLTLLTQGSLTHSRAIKQWLLRDIETCKEIGKLVCRSMDPQSIYLYAKLVDLTENADLKKQLVDSGRPVAVLVNLSNYVTSPPLTLEKMTIGQNALTNGTALNAMMKVATVQDRSCLFGHFRKRYPYLERIQAYLSTPQENPREHRDTFFPTDTTTTKDYINSQHSMIKSPHKL